MKPLTADCGISCAVCALHAWDVARALTVSTINTYYYYYYYYYYYNGVGNRTEVQSALELYK